MAIRKKKAPRSPARPKSPAPLVFEVAWEICQQLGGIYTVMRSKCTSMVEQLGNRYYMVGPWNPKASPMEFEEAPDDPTIKKALDLLRAEGIGVHYGDWLVTGRPRTILLDLTATGEQLAEIKYLYWKHYQIDLPPGDSLLDDVLVFGDRVHRFVDALTQTVTDRPLLAQFHEWMAASCIPDIRRRKLPIATVFTTHATMLGRCLAVVDPWFYDRLPTIDWNYEARRTGAFAQICMERLAARDCTTFTTVSEVTGLECRYLLGRAPDVILPNGLNIERYLAIHEFQNLHRVYKEKIHEFVMGHFFPSYSFDLDKTIYCFTSGRYEYRNKGFDLTLEALARLNHHLKQTKSEHTIVFFLVTRRPFHSINPDVLARRAMMEEMRNTVEAIKEQVGGRLFVATARQQSPRLDSLVDERWLLRLRQFIHAWKTELMPPIVTHNLADDAHDEVLNQLRASNLVNRPEDRVKVVYHPDFISPNSPLFGMDYSQFVRGCHLGVFPSCYEPWGYTPMECVASGIPAVTSDFSGFGAYLAKNHAGHRRRGVHVVRRRGLKFSESADDLVEFFLEFLELDRRDRIKVRNRVEAFSENFGWSHLAAHYFEAHDHALAHLA